MGIAAYNRGSDLISRQLRPSRMERHKATMREIAKRMNDLPKLDVTCHVREDVHMIAAPNGQGFWVRPARCTDEDYAEYYRSLKEAITHYPNHFLIGTQVNANKELYWLAAYVAQS